MMTRRQQQRRMAQFLIGILFQLIPGVMILPVISFGLAAQGVEAWLIGALATVGSVSYMLALPATPALIGRIGEHALFRAAVLAGAGANLGLALSGWPALWVLLYALAGGAAGVRFTLAESWAAAMAPPEVRGRTLAIFQTSIGAAAFVGAGLLLLTGVEGMLPRAVIIATTLVGAVVLWPVRPMRHAACSMQKAGQPASEPSHTFARQEPTAGSGGGWGGAGDQLEARTAHANPASPSEAAIGRQGRHPPAPRSDTNEALDGADSLGVAPGLRTAILQIGPLVLGASLISGFFESGLWVTLPLYGLEIGMSSALAVGLVTAMGLGSLVQYPFGALADRFAWRHVTIGAVALVALGALLLPLALIWPGLLLVLGVVWGSAGGGLYTLATIRNGAIFQGPQLVRASVVTQVAYMVGEVVGPTLSGLMIDLAPYYGLPALLGAVGLTALGLMLWQPGRRVAPQSA